MMTSHPSAWEAQNNILWEQRFLVVLVAIKFYEQPKAPHRPKQHKPFQGFRSREDPTGSGERQWEQGEHTCGEH